MKAPQMQFFRYARSQHMTDEPFTGTAYFMLFSGATAPKCRRNSENNKSVSRKGSLDTPFFENTDKRSPKYKNRYLKLIIRNAN